jgi:hypothetical protein
VLLEVSAHARLPANDRPDAERTVKKAAGKPAARAA